MISAWAAADGEDSRGRGRGSWVCPLSRDKRKRLALELLPGCCPLTPSSLPDAQSAATFPRSPAASRWPLPSLPL